MFDEKKIDRLREIKEQQEKLKEEADRLEGEIILATKEELANTKFKTLTHSTENGSRITVTVAESVKTVYPTMLKSIFGAAYEDMVKEEKKYTLSAAAKRLLTNLWTGKYIEQTLAEAVAQLPVDDDTGKKLEKKLKGVKFATDKKNLINIGGLSEQDAGEYAYLITEAATWEQFENLMRVNHKNTKEEVDEIIGLINSSVTVDETTKITVESAEQE